MTTAIKKSKVNSYVQGKTEILNAFSVKGYKSWHAREGVGAESTLYKDDKKIGWVVDDGNGGEVSLRATGEDWKTVKDFLDTLPKYKFNDMWKAQYNETWNGSKKSELESWKVHDFANVMLEEAEEQAQLKKACKTKTLIRLEGEGLKDYRSYNVKWPSDTYGQLQIGSQLSKQLLPKVIVEIVNKRFI